LSSRALANFAGFLIVFISVLVLGGLVSFVTGRVLKVTGLSVVDHLLGAAFGLVRGILICVALVLGLMAFSLSDRPPDAVVHSRVAPYVVDVARVVAAAAPHELKDGFSRSYSQVKDAWEKALKQGIQKLPEESKKNERKI
jgi:membrane protein required for colicin V production